MIKKLSDAQKSTLRKALLTLEKELTLNLYGMLDMDEKIILNFEVTQFGTMITEFVQTEGVMHEPGGEVVAKGDNYEVSR